MERIVAPRKPFERILQELHNDQYLTKEVTASTPWGHPLRQYTRPENCRQKAVLLDMTLQKARKFAEQGMVTPQQELALKELVTMKKEEVAQYNYSINPRSTFKSQGDVYQLVQLDNEKYACVNMSEYQLRPDGVTWLSKRSPHISFTGTPINDNRRISTDRLCMIKTITNHRPVAYDLYSMNIIENHPNWRPLLNRKFAETTANNLEPGMYVIRPSDYNEYICLTYRTEKGVAHDRFHKETGFLEGDQSELPLTIYQRMEQLEQCHRTWQQSARPADRGALPPRPPRKNVQAQVNSPVYGSGAVPGKIRQGSPVKAVAPMPAAVEQKNKAQGRLRSKMEARREIQLLAAGNAVRYREFPGEERILIKGTNARGEVIVLDLRYFHEKREVAQEFSKERMNAAAYLRTVGINHPISVW
jgi:hypothetical protein